MPRIALPLYASVDSDEPVRAYVDDPETGRRIRVELRLAGRVIEAVPMDLPEYEEPIAAERYGSEVPEARSRPFSADDFTGHAGEPAGAHGR